MVGRVTRTGLTQVQADGAVLRSDASTGLSKKEIMRCLKRYIIREVHTALLADFTALNST